MLTDSTNLEIEIGHVLFIDIVGYSKMAINEQQESLHKLSQVVRNTEASGPAETEETLPRLSTGSGIALAFVTSADEPVRSAVQICKGLRSYPELKVRMGIHSGPVKRTTHPNDQLSVAGQGVNMARRVTDCGDTGHILLSKQAVEHLTDRWHWQPYLHDLGQFEVTAGEIVSAANFYTNEVGNPAVPKKFKRKNGGRHGDSVRLSPVPAQNTLLAILFFSAVALAIGYWILFPPHASNSAKSSTEPEVQIMTAEHKDRNHHGSVGTHPSPAPQYH